MALSSRFARLGASPRATYEGPSGINVDLVEQMVEAATQAEALLSEIRRIDSMDIWKMEISDETFREFQSRTQGFHYAPGEFDY